MPSILQCKSTDREKKLIFTIAASSRVEFTPDKEGSSAVKSSDRAKGSMGREGKHALQKN